MRLLVRSLSIVACVVGLSGAAAPAEQVDNPQISVMVEVQAGNVGDVFAGRRERVLRTRADDEDGYENHRRSFWK